MSRRHNLLPVGTCVHLYSMGQQAVKIKQVDVFGSEMNLQYNYVGILYPIDCGVVVYFQHSDIQDVFIPDEHFVATTLLLNEPVGCCTASARHEILKSLPGCSLKKVEPENCPICNLYRE